MFMGIDPGKNGSIAIVNEYAEIKLHVKTPIVKLKKNEYDIPEMYNILDQKQDISICVLEKAQAMPGQGVTSMFSIGKGYGIWLGLLTACKIPYIEVHPRVWTKELLKGSGAEGKERNYLKARQLFPRWQPKYKYEKEYSDSLLLAEYGRVHR